MGKIIQPQLQKKNIINVNLLDIFLYGTDCVHNIPHYIRIQETGNSNEVNKGRQMAKTWIANEIKINVNDI